MNFGLAAQSWHDNLPTHSVTVVLLSPLGFPIHLETESEVDADFHEPSEVIRPALEYISIHFRENITIRQLAAVVHLSESYFMNQFQKYVGFSAIEYISHFRINQACKRLTSTKESVLEIAFDCGFRNISNFNRQFRKVAGCSPTEYRRKMKSAE